MRITCPCCGSDSLQLDTPEVLDAVGGDVTVMQSAVCKTCGEEVRRTAAPMTFGAWCRQEWVPVPVSQDGAA